MRSVLLLIGGIGLGVLAACADRNDDLAAADCARMIEEDPEMMRGMMGPLVSDSAMGSEMMETMMRNPRMRSMMMHRMMADSQMHREMMEVMGDMPGMQGMQGMPGMEGMSEPGPPTDNLP